MTTYSKPNYVALIEYLARFDIDAKRIPVKSVTADGYEYWADPNDTSSPIRLVDSGGRLTNHRGERKEWPNKKVYETVVKLLAGGELPVAEPKITGLPAPTEDTPPITKTVKK